MKPIILLLLMIATSMAHIGNTEDILNLNIQVSPDKFKVDEPFYLEYSLKNIGTNAVYILDGPYDFEYFVKDYMSGKKNSSDYLNYNQYVPERDSFVLIKPSECYTYTHDKPMVIHKNTNGNYRVQFSGRPDFFVAETGFIIGGSFHGSFYPIENVYDIDEFKDMDQSVPLFDGFYQLKSRIVDPYIYDGEYFQRKKVSSYKTEEAHASVFLNDREVKCARFERQNALFTYVVDTVRIEVKRDAFEDSLDEFIKSRGFNSKGIDYLKHTQVRLKQHNLSSEIRRCVEELLSELLVEGECQIYDLSLQEYIKSFVVAELKDDCCNEVAFLRKDRKVLFYNWITVRK